MLAGVFGRWMHASGWDCREAIGESSYIPSVANPAPPLPSAPRGATRGQGWMTLLDLPWVPGPCDPSPRICNSI